MPSFSPPATDVVPADYVGGTDPYYPASKPLRTLWGRFRQPAKAPNVYKLTALGSSQFGGATYVSDGPGGVGQPYDWPFQGAVIAFTYYGAHTYPVTQAEADALTAAGFGSGVTP